MRTIEQVKEGLLQECPFGSGLKVGDVVTYTNDYGAEFEGKEIIGFASNKTSWAGYIYLNKDSYWFPVALKSITKQNRVEQKIEY